MIKEKEQLDKAIEQFKAQEIARFFKKRKRIEKNLEAKLAKVDSQIEKIKKLDYIPDNQNWCYQN